MNVHLALAEAGKQQMLNGEHSAALERFRCALDLAIHQSAPVVFLLHYTDCVLDCLEAAGDNAQALELAQRALDDDDGLSEPLRSAVRASLVQRVVALTFLLGREDDGDALLAHHSDLSGGVLDEIRRVRSRRLHIDDRWLERLRARHTPSVVNDRHLRQTDATSGEALFQKEFAHG